MDESGRKDRPLILLLCAVAAVRVFIYAAAFPFFNNVDEAEHFDLVARYSEGRIPRALEPVSAESARVIVEYGSPEFLLGPGQFSDGKIPPPIWRQPADEVANGVDRDVATWQTITNHEASQPPLYYSVAGVWMKVGWLLGLKGGLLLYWVRFLNVFLAAALVWISFVAAKELFPERRFVQLGVPMLVAFMPQDTFYSIQSDVLSPLCFGVAFVGLVKFLREDVPSKRTALIAGLALAATCLVKTSNLPLLAVTAVALLFKVRRLVKAGMLPAALKPLGLLLICACVPIAVWFAWNISIYGDLTGTTAKIEWLGWRRKAFGDWWSHPIFSPLGAWLFSFDLMASFWRGEFYWFGKQASLDSADAFYWLSSVLFVGLALVGLIPRFNTLKEQQTRMLWFGFWCFASLVAFLGLLSVAFDFGKCLYPSRVHPYFTSGRLLSGALIPFLLLYVHGLDWALSRVKREWMGPILLAGIVLLMTISEIVVSRSVFASRYNWFHLWTENSRVERPGSPQTRSSALPN